MRAIKAWFWVASLALLPASYADTIEVEVNGLTCAFCIDSLQRQLKKMPDVERVDVSLKFKKVRIVSRADNINIEQVKEIVINSGFTPVRVRKINDEP